MWGAVWSATGSGRLFKLRCDATAANQMQYPLGMEPRYDESYHTCCIEQPLHCSSGGLHFRVARRRTALCAISYSRWWRTPHSLISSISEAESQRLLSTISGFQFRSGEILADVPYHFPCPRWPSAFLSFRRIFEFYNGLLSEIQIHVLPHF